METSNSNKAANVSKLSFYLIFVKFLLKLFFEYFLGRLTGKLVEGLILPWKRVVQLKYFDVHKITILYYAKRFGFYFFVI